MIGNYILGPVLGRGGMSEVHGARHRFLGDRVAIKLLRAHLAGDAEAIAAFIAEATRTRAIDHPNVVRVIDFGSDGDDCYLVMELVEGESLAARLAATPRLDEARVRALGAAIADGLSAAHARGIVHRDLKPSNIMLAGDTPKIVDFGIARTFDGAATVTGTRIGTLAYMAPEQITGGLIAPCLDVWALGVVLYEALAGRLPFDDFSGGRAPQLFESPPRLATLAVVSPALEALIEACLTRDPTRRPPSMRAIAEALRRSTADQRITEALPPSIERDTQALATGGRGAHEPVHILGSAPARPAHEGDLGAAPGIGRSRWRGRATAIAALGVVAVAVGWMLHARSPGVASPSASSIATRSATEPPSVVAVSGLASGTVAGAAGSGGLAGAAGSGGVAGAAGSGGVAGGMGSGGVAGSAAAPAGVSAVVAPAARFVVEIRSAPAGAAVIVASKRVAITPATIALEAPASILLTRAGYRASRVRAERAGSIDVRLVRARPPRARPATGETLD